MRRTIIAIAAALSCLCASAQTKDWARTDFYTERNSAVATSPKAVFMGDSITDNWGNRTHPEFFSDHNFAGRGISGQTTAQMLIRFRPDVIDLHPKYVVILAGTNDIALNNGPIDHDKIVGNIISMCELAKANRIKPIICSILPAYKYGWRPQVTDAAEQVMDVNTMLKAYAAKAKIQYVDYHSVMKDERNGLPEKYAADGIHPNMDGYAVMEEIILKYIK